MGKNHYDFNLQSVNSLYEHISDKKLQEILFLKL